MLSPGEYHFKSTGEIVVNPDFMTSWTITRPSPNEVTEDDWR